MKLARHVTRMGEVRNAYKILVGKPEGKKTRRKPRRREEDNIRMDLREIGWECVDWEHVAQDRDHYRVLVNTVMNLPVT
jgi:ribosome biogenesis protein Nip4